MFYVDPEQKRLLAQLAMIAIAFLFFSVIFPQDDREKKSR